MKKIIIIFSLIAAFQVFSKGNIIEGKIKVEQVCMACHGLDGQGIDDTYPKLAGQFQDYMVKALEDYKSGARKNAIMSAFATPLTKQDIENVASYYSSLTENRLEDLSIK
jgi:cytochrome c553